jgi:hypothetical protein
MDHNRPFNALELRPYLDTYTSKRGITYTNRIDGASFVGDEQACLLSIHRTMKILEAEYGTPLAELQRLWQAHIAPAAPKPNRVSFQDLKQRPDFQRRVRRNRQRKGTQ